MSTYQCTQEIHEHGGMRQCKNRSRHYAFFNDADGHNGQNYWILCSSHARSGMYGHLLPEMVVIDSDRGELLRETEGVKRFCND